ncbi:PDR/VanB family oxidoreductase [Variovorax saccharolyticus]|uniref:PDR/VanB family oxidoreductase n=1 Tax=Variovorax saccharolyticus TaxID=3053516 RepID=UPI002576599C|nr:PDR/VanB family oxidoreductase [Variovorax sp. J22R187]MDM0021911.1 PDR/VanB family oxidoreductase [Variovorax sp. J22R187]
MSDEHRTVRLVGIRFAGDGTNLFEFAPLKGDALPGFAPGAHIDVFLPNGLSRQYSLCNGPADAGLYVIGVKLDRNSRGGSRYMHEQLRTGALLEISAPRNHFELCETAPHSVLIAGGIGITPIACMVERLKAIGGSWELHYSVRHRDEAIFLDRLAGPALHLHVDAEQPEGGYVDVAAIVAAAAPSSHLYCCGPAQMLDAFEVAASSRPSSKVHLERFGATVDAAKQGGFTVTLAKTGQRLKIAPGETILEAVRACGVPARASCEQGVCGACETRVLGGLPDHRDSLLSSDEKLTNDVMMICCSGSLTPELVLDL